MAQAQQLAHAIQPKEQLPAAGVGARQCPAGVRLLQRMCSCGSPTAAVGECAECRKKRLQRRPDRAAEPAAVPPIVHDVLRSPGQPLDAATRAFMDPRFGHDFSQVRIHTDSRAAESASAVNALAYTVGHDVVFGKSQYQPETHGGRHLLAHELTHVVQQETSGTPSPSADLEIDDAHGVSERVATQLAERVLASRGAPASPVAPARSPALQRAVSPDMPTVRERLSTGAFNSVTEEEAHEVLLILKRLRRSSVQDFGDTVAAMERAGLVTRLLSSVSETDRRGERETLRQIANARVFVREHREGGTTVTTTVTGSCSPERFQTIAVAATQALTWLGRAISLTDAFLAAPADAAHARVRSALELHFNKNTTPAVVRHIRGRLDHIRTDITTVDPFTVECHDSWDPACNSAGAYIPGGQPEEMIFCAAFFRGGNEWRIETIIHEMAHTQVGGAHITDRGYAADRVLPFLSTAEALTNAESYGLYVQQLATGRVPAMPAPRDTNEDCPRDWWGLIQRAIARAQRANRNALVVTEDLTVAGLGTWTATQLRWLGGRSQGDIDRVKRTYRRAEDRLASRVDFECEPDGGGRCERYETYWWATGDFHICPSWRRLASEEDRIVSLLSGLYGYFDLEDDNTRRRNAAALAQNLTATRWAAPALSDVLGSPAWRSDEVRILVDPDVPSVRRYQYEESGLSQERVSDVLPVYQGPDFQNATLTFRCTVLFALDRARAPRPAPFTPPRVSVLFEFNGRRGAFRRSERDPRPNYGGANVALTTTFPTQFSFNLPSNGTLRMHFELDDPDSGVRRVYDDQIEIVTERIRDIPSPGPTRVA